MIKAKLIDAVAVAALLGCSPRSVYRLADSGRIPWGCKVGRLRRWSQDEIDQWITEQSRKRRVRR